MFLSEQESIFCQALATTSLLAELHNNGFLNSDYYNKNVIFAGNNDNFKKILEASGLGNPATMQMFLYILLVMPKETLTGLDDATIESWENELKSTIQLFSPEVEVTTSYPTESSSNLSSINYYRHIRNAVSHAKCVYENENGCSYVTFKDKNPKNVSQSCEIKMLTSHVGTMLGVLHELITTYLNNQWSTR